jgi:hypothetical protein
MARQVFWVFDMLLVGSIPRGAQKIFPDYGRKFGGGKPHLTQLPEHRMISVEINRHKFST